MGSIVLSFGLVLVLGLAASVSGDEVPVFVWGDLEHTSRHGNPLEKTSSAQFEHELRAELTQQQLLVAFVEETLSVEDLSRRDSTGASPLPYLRSNLKHSLYFPAVSSPVGAIAHVSDEESTDRVRLTDTGLSAEIRPDSDVVIISLADARADEPREELLRRHDRFMRETVRKLSARGGVVAVYTARYPSWSLPQDSEPTRYRRQVEQANATVSNSTDSNSTITSSDVSVYNVTNLLLAVSNITLKSASMATVAVEIPAAGPAVEANETSVNVTVQDSRFKVTLRIVDGSSGSAGYWYLREADVTELTNNTEEKFTLESVYALHNFSYHCGRVTVSGINGTYTLTLNQLQLQPFFYGSVSKFGDAFDCVGFTTIPIWSGLFVLSIILAIFFYGVASMMDIRTMDRFDDPKGKTITINASE